MWSASAAGRTASCYSPPGLRLPACPAPRARPPSSRPSPFGGMTSRPLAASAAPSGPPRGPWPSPP
eukprot:4053322-Pyramimonas_sp.AAC.1